MSTIRASDLLSESVAPIAKAPAPMEPKAKAAAKAAVPPKAKAKANAAAVRNDEADDDLMPDTFRCPGGVQTTLFDQEEAG